MTAPTAAMVFAAGLGTRMRPLTADTPKGLIRAAGRTLLDRALDVFDGQVRRIVVNTHYLPDRIAAHLAAEHRFDLVLSHEPTLLDTGGGLRAALPHLGGGHVWTLNADNVWSVPPLPLPALRPVAGGARLLVVPRDRAVGHPGRGDFTMDAQGRLARRGTAASAPYVYVGLQVIDTACVAGPPGAVFSLNTVWDRLLDQGLLFGAVYPGRWCDVGQPASLDLAAEMLRG